MSTALTNVIRAQAALISEQQETILALSRELEKACEGFKPRLVTNDPAWTPPAAQEEIQQHVAKAEADIAAIAAVTQTVTTEAPAQALVSDEAAPAAPAAEEKPKRKRRTKAEIEADKLAEAQKVLEQQQAAAAPPQYDPAAAPPEPPQASGWAPSW